MRFSEPTWKWLLIVSGLLLLLMMLFYPFGYDQAVFSVGGEMTVKQGAIPYRDFLDTKPPLIFYLYALSSIIFGHHEWSIRAFDILFQIGSLFYFFKILKRTTGDEKLALSSIFLYTLFYVTSGYWMTAQAETFALLPSLIAFDLTEKVRSPKSEVRSHQIVLGIYAGLACAILFLLKFTLLTVPLGIIIYLLFETKEGKSFPWKYIIGLAIGLIALIGLYALYLLANGAMDQFLESVTWLKSYGDADPLFSSHTIIERFFKQFPMLSIYPFGLSGIVIATIGILWYFQDHLRPNPSEESKKDTALLHLFLQFSLALVAVLYERKFFPYHFMRGYWAFVPFVALGLRELRNLWKDYSLTWSRLRKAERILRCVFIGIVIASIFFFSTAPRLISQPLHFAYIRVTGGDVAQDVQDQTPQYYYKDEQMLANRLRPLMKDDDKIFVWGNSIGIYYFLNKYPTTICLTNTPLISPWTPELWKTQLMNQLKANPPHYFIGEFGDERTYITGSNLDSWQYLQNWHELKAFLLSQYEQTDSIGHFRIFKNKR